MEHLHPIVIHFPIAWIVTALAFDAAALGWRCPAWLDRVGVIMHALALFGAGGAVLTGRWAAEGLGQPRPPVERLVQGHAEWAFFTFLVFALGLGLRIESAWRDRQRERLRAHLVRLLAFVVGLAALAILLETAGRGASLVHDYGIGVGS